MLNAYINEQISGLTLRSAQRVLWENLRHGNTDEDGFCELFEEYLKRITPADPTAPVCRDMIFSNIITDNDPDIIEFETL